MNVKSTPTAYPNTYEYQVCVLILPTSKKKSKLDRDWRLTDADATTKEVASTFCPFGNVLSNTPHQGLSLPAEIKMNSKQERLGSPSALLRVQQRTAKQEHLVDAFDNQPPTAYIHTYRKSNPTA